MCSLWEQILSFKSSPYFGSDYRHTFQDFFPCVKIRSGYGIGLVVIIVFQQQKYAGGITNSSCDPEKTISCPVILVFTFHIRFNTLLCDAFISCCAGFMPCEEQCEQRMLRSAYASVQTNQGLLFHR